MSEPQTEAGPPEDDAHALLRACDDSRHCARMADALGPQVPPVELEYEDVFYPLRCHHDAGLALVLEYTYGERHAYVWGAGDFIYHVEDPDRTMQSAKDTTELWHAVQSAETTVTVTIVPGEANDT